MTAAVLQTSLHLCTCSALWEAAWQQRLEGFLPLGQSRVAAADRSSLESQADVTSQTDGLLLYSFLARWVIAMENSHSYIQICQDTAGL